jgi:hypothetical protein
MVCGLTQLVLITRQNVLLGIPDKLFIITDNIVIVTIAELTQIPLLIYSSRICPKYMEGTYFTARHNVRAHHIGRELRQSPGLSLRSLSLELPPDIRSQYTYLIIDFDNLWIMCVVSNVFIIIPMLLLYAVNFNKAIELTKLAHLNQV